MERIAHNAMHRWHEQIDAASSIEEVITDVQDFLATMSPVDSERLPEEWHPRLIRDASDIDAWNVRLADAVRALWAKEGDHEILTEVAQLFLRASVKVSRLNGENPTLP